MKTIAFKEKFDQTGWHYRQEFNERRGVYSVDCTSWLEDEDGSIIRAGHDYHKEFDNFKQAEDYYYSNVYKEN